MKKSLSRICAVLLTIAIMISTVPISVFASESVDNSVNPSLENDISVDSTNSFGGLLSQTINAEMEKQLENNGFNVFSIQYNEGEASVSLEALQDCTLFVGIYSEDGKKLITSQNIDVTKDDTLITLYFDTSVVPQYFIIQAYLINTADLKPLCNVYKSTMYTQEMQEFLAKTTDDFEEEKVLQLDDDKTNNFAVFNDTVEIIENNAEMTVTADEEKGIYTITNPTDEVKTLGVGDIFSYNYENGDVLILKIASISTDKNGTITYTEGELELEDVFDYIKIDNTVATQEAEVDNTDLEEGITYEGLFPEATTFGLDEGITAKYSHRIKFKDYQVSNKDNFKRKGFELPEVQGSITGSVGIDLSVTLKLYQTLKSISTEIRFDYTVSADFTVSGSIMGKIPLGGTFKFSPVFGVTVKVSPAVVGIVSASASLTFKLYGTVGFLADTASGITNLTTTPKLSVELRGEIKVFFGISLLPEIKLISKKIAVASVNAVAGVEMIGVTNPKISSDDIKHNCFGCIEGEMKGVLNLSFGVKLLNNDKFSFDFTLVNFELKICDYYYSLAYDEFDFTTCPHKEYRLTVNVKDSGGKNLKDIAVNIGGKSYTTNILGNVSVLLPNGSYTVSIVNDKYIPSSKRVTINDAPQKITRKLSLMGDSSGGGSSSGVVSTGVNKLSMGANHSAVITEDGNLYTWGNNGYGQLGNGTKISSVTPIKIMDNVASVSLSNYHSAAITRDGSLYTWGHNGYSQLGNGTKTDSATPIKIMDNISTVSLGRYHSAAITKDGSLYIWGRNNYGQLGDGTTTDRLKPKKIMDNVELVSLGEEHSAAVTKDGSLYTWGENYKGKLGNGTTTNSTKPIKIMDNIAILGFGNGHSAAITKEGALYLWGLNNSGQLGNGTTTDSTRPIKIMDNVATVSLGGNFSAAITKDGTLYTWGVNSYGELGNGTRTDSTKPIKIMDNVATVSVRATHSAAITKDGTLYTWGENSSGQLGNGTTTTSTRPIKITIPNTTIYSLRNIANDFNTFTELIPNFVYNYYVMESDEVTNLLNSQNLKFIGQAISDENGNLTLPEYTADIASTEPTIVLKEFARVSGEVEYLISSEGTAIITGCTAENTVTIPEKLGDYTPTAIANMAFETCYNLTDVTLANSITEIADGTFFAQENIVLHSNCKNDNTYFEEFATEQEIKLTIEHDYGNWTTVTEPTPVETGVKHMLCTECGDEVTEEIPTVEKLAFKGASLTLQDNLAINYKVDKALFDTVGYTNPYVVFEVNGKKTTVKTYSVEGDRYVFRFRNIAPNQMNDTINATLYATYNGKKYASETREYSVAEYCYSTLGKYSADEYAELRTLLVDLLHYGAQSQLYTNYNTENLVDANLTDEQLLWGTSEEPTLNNALNTTYETVENPIITWKGASLNLNDSVAMRFKFVAEDINGLSLKITSDSGSWTITSKNFTLEDGVYSVIFNELNAGQMSEKVYLTMYKNGVAVSNTVCYSIESYAYSKQNSTVKHLSNLVKAMMKYGNSAYAYVN